MRSIEVFVTSSLLACVAHAQSTELVSVNSTGAAGDGDSFAQAISHDGRFVLFSTFSHNIGPPSNHTPHLILRDRVANQTIPITISGDGSVLEYGASGALSADGRYVAFVSDSSVMQGEPLDIIPNVFVRDVVAGITTRASVGLTSPSANSSCRYSDISADGRFVVFSSHADNLVPNDTNGEEDVFVRDLVAGTTERVSLTLTGLQLSEGSMACRISGDGRFVVFGTISAALDPTDTNGVFDVFVRDRQTGKTERVSVDLGGAGGVFQSFQPAISGNGRYVAFTSGDPNLSDYDDPHPYADVFVKDRWTGRLEVISPGNGNSMDPRISYDGRFVAFNSGATNLVAADTNGKSDVFLHDRVLGQTVRVNVSNSGAQSDLASGVAAISLDGRHAAFWSAGQNLSTIDSDLVADAFVRDLPPWPSPISSFCSGDGVFVDCTCVNNGATGHGCANTEFATGALLTGVGNAMVTSDSVVLRAEQMTGSVCVFFQGTEDRPAIVIDDGVGCLAGAILRIGSAIVVNGAAQYPNAGDLPVSVKGMVGAQGDNRYYQALYRNAAELFCPPSSTNRTNGLVIQWSP